VTRPGVGRMTLADQFHDMVVGMKVNLAASIL
jgi:hypothetical protein